MHCFPCEHFYILIVLSAANGFLGSWTIVSLRARALLGFLRLALAVVLLLLFLLPLLLCKSFPLLFNTPLDALTPQGSTEACLLFFSVCARPIEKDQKTNDRSFFSLSFSPFFLKNIILIYIYIHASRLFFILMLFTGLSLSLSLLWLHIAPYTVYMGQAQTQDFLPDCWGVFQKNTWLSQAAASAVHQFPAE